MKDPDRITDIDGQAVLTGIAMRGCDGATAVCIGFYDPADEDDPDPILLLDSYMAHELAGQLAYLADAHLGPPAAGSGAPDADDSDDEHVSLTSPLNYRLRALAGRLVLAYITGDDDARYRAADDVADCPGCWRIIAEKIAATATSVTVTHFGHDEAIRMAEGVIADALDHADEEDQS